MFVQKIADVNAIAEVITFMYVDVCLCIYREKDKHVKQTIV